MVEPTKTIFIACKEDMVEALLAAKMGGRTFTSDWLMNCVMTQQLDLDPPQFTESLRTSIFITPECFMILYSPTSAFPKSCIPSESSCTAAAERLQNTNESPQATAPTSICNDLFPEACQVYMSDHLHIEEGLIPRMYLDLFNEHGTTIIGLRTKGRNGFDDDEFHARVHLKLPYDVLKSDPVSSSVSDLGSIVRPIPNTPVVLFESSPELPDLVIDSPDESAVVSKTEHATVGETNLIDELSDDEEFGYPSDLDEDFSSEESSPLPFDDVSEASPLTNPAEKAVCRADVSVREDAAVLDAEPLRSEKMVTLSDSAPSQKTANSADTVGEHNESEISSPNAQVPIVNVDEEDRQTSGEEVGKDAPSKELIAANPETVCESQPDLGEAAADSTEKRAKRKMRKRDGSTVAERVEKKLRAMKEKNISKRTGEADIQHRPRDKEVPDSDLITPEAQIQGDNSLSTVSLTTYEMLDSIDVNEVDLINESLLIVLQQSEAKATGKKDSELPSLSAAEEEERRTTLAQASEAENSPPSPAPLHPPLLPGARIASPPQAQDRIVVEEARGATLRKSTSTAPELDSVPGDDVPTTEMAEAVAKEVVDKILQRMEEYASRLDDTDVHRPQSEGEINLASDRETAMFEGTLDKGTSTQTRQIPPTFLAQLRGLFDEKRRALKNYVDEALKDIRNDLAIEIKSIRVKIKLLKGEIVKFFKRVAPVVDYPLEKLDVSGQNIAVILENQKIQAKNSVTMFENDKIMRGQQNTKIFIKMDVCTNLLDDHMLEVKNQVTAAVNYLETERSEACTSRTMNLIEEVKKEESEAIRTNTENMVWETNLVRGSLGLEPV
ncbi:hypothetical protein KSP40_PGU002160 [Platanthera guangdongensis]|uniref:BRCT domain-containing protein n=1 Tax=Platanthera guangdongensis TaxID=2320717 RepID=A0ABR2LV67_9ASPA